MITELRMRQYYTEDFKQFAVQQFEKERDRLPIVSYPTGSDGRCKGICSSVLQLDASAFDVWQHDTDEFRKVSYKLSRNS